MNAHRAVKYVIVYLYMCTVQYASGYFGIAARQLILTTHLGPHMGSHTNMIYDKTEDTSADELCDMMQLPRKQKQMCRQEKGVTEALLEAIKLSTHECEFQFRNERWNCSIEHRLRILKKGFKETSFLYAISSAGLVHTFARACSRGTIDRCTCDESKNLQNRETWRWGGCGDNVKFGLTFSQRFSQAGQRRGKDISAKVDQHNILLGRKVIRSAVKTRCKCHGLSGSCTVQTCWRQLSTFLHSGSTLKNKYENAYRVVKYTNHATGKLSPMSEEITLENNAGNIVETMELSNAIAGNGNRSGKVNSNKSKRDKISFTDKIDYNSASWSYLMVYLEDSPSFCDESSFSGGTKGRVCDRSNCDVMCCGRGYNIRSVMVKRACQCQVQWCCHVDCKQCISEGEVFLCK